MPSTGRENGVMTTSFLTEIDHVAIAVNDLEAAIAYYRDVYGAEVDHREIVDPTELKRRSCRWPRATSSSSHRLDPTHRLPGILKSAAKGSITSVIGYLTARRRLKR